MGSLHLEALYPAVAAVIVGVLAYLKRAGRSDDAEQDINVTTLVRALAASEAERQEEQAARQKAEQDLAVERERREACERRERRRRT